MDGWVSVVAWVAGKLAGRQARRSSSKAESPFVGVAVGLPVIGLSVAAGGVGGG